MIASFNNRKAEYKKAEFARLDLGQPVPDDGYTYVMAMHEKDLLAESWVARNPNPIPAVVNTTWGIETLAKANGDYYTITPAWQQWFLEFWDYHSGYRLPMGEALHTYAKPMNPDAVYTKYTPGSLFSLYAGMIEDAKCNTDAAPVERGSRDVVTKRNMESRRDWDWLCRPHTGALLRVLARVGSKLKIEAIDLWKRQPHIPSLGMHLFYFGTQVHNDGTVTRFPDVAREFAAHGYPPDGYGDASCRSRWLLLDRSAGVPCITARHVMEAVHRIGR